VPILLERLSNDPEPEVRRIAANFLGWHRNLSDVVAALEIAASNDPDESGRSYAAGVLEREIR
jgi:HEAT repeat protein